MVNTAELRDLIAGRPEWLLARETAGNFPLMSSEIEVVEERPMLPAAESMLGNVAELPLRSREQLEQAREAYFAELDRHVPRDFGGLVVDKLPLNMLGLSVIHCLFPDARIVFAQRHPCDAALSGFMQSFTLNDAMAGFLTIEDAADLYDAAMTLFMRSRDALPLATHERGAALLLRSLDMYATSTFSGFARGGLPGLR
jgi:hypothetical protein